MRQQLILFILVIWTPIFSSNVAATSLNQEELNIIKNVQKMLPIALKDLKMTVNTNSGTMNFSGVEKVGQQFQELFHGIGFQTKWIDGSDFNRAGHLFAEYQGSQLPKINILLIGHLDTVFSESDKFQSFKEIENGFIEGPGITDMKGGNIIMLYALKALKQQGLLEKSNIQVVLTGDEESSGKPLSKSKNVLIEAAKWADIALGFEDGDGDIRTAVISRRGASGWQLKVNATPAHSSQVFSQSVGFGAIFEAARILNQFRENLSHQEYLTFNPGLIAGGTQIEHLNKMSRANVFGKNNVVAKELIVTGDIRAISPEQLLAAREKMKTIVDASLPGTDAEISFTEGYPPMAPSEGNKQLLAIYNQISRDLGYGSVVAVNPIKAGAADISFAANHVKMAIDGLGLMGEGGHTNKEKADISSLEKNINKAALLIYRLSQ